MSRHAAVIAVLSLLILSSPVISQGSVLKVMPENPLEGAAVFDRKGCGKCHAIWGAGGGLGPDLAKVDQGWSVVEFAGVLWNHSPKMLETMQEMKIPRPKLTPEEMAALTAFIYYLSFFDSPGDPARGQQLISSKRCIECHSLGGRGGTVGPALDKYGHSISPIFLATAMWNHGAQMAAKMKERHVPRPQLFGAEIADLLAYINRAAKAQGQHFTHMFVGSPRRGAEIFRLKRCIACHAVRGEGGTVGPDLAKKQLPKKASAVAATMWNHAPKMWAKMAEREIRVPTFVDSEMADLIAYLSFLAYSDLPGDPLRGQRVLQGKGCLRCHAMRGRGGDEGPDLATSKELDSPIEFVTAIWNHAPNMEKAFRREGIQWPNFVGTEMADLVAYLQGMRRKRQKAR